MAIREIIFRAKTYSNKWVFGYLIKGNVDNDFYIKENLSEDAYWIDKNTVGQFTGLTDKNGKKIFEGDIVKWDEKEWGRPYNELVEFDYKLLAMREHDYKQWCEVIGNIYDNPELLGE